MIKKGRKGNYVIYELPVGTKLSCGCDARDEVGGSWGPSAVTGMEAVVESPPASRGPRVMRLYLDGTIRHARCGRISTPLSPAPYWELLRIIADTRRATEGGCYLIARRASRA